MKKYRYKGPSGVVEIKSPLHVRLVESSWMLTLWAVGFMAWGAYYLIYADPYVFIGKELSIGHKVLQSDCITCHQPFVGVSDETCTSTGCHSAVAKEKATLHDSLGHRCTDCHWEHTDGAFISFGLGEKDCAECHEKLKNDPDSKFYAGNADQRKMTDVSRKIFKHRSHQFPPHYKCWQCHCTGKGTLDTPMEELYKMSACLLCHEEKACGVCLSSSRPNGAPATGKGRRAIKTSPCARPESPPWTTENNRRRKRRSRNPPSRKGRGSHRKARDLKIIPARIPRTNI
jgi:hypothetical protein